MIRRRDKQSGQAALETLIVFGLWFALGMLGVNVMMIIAALMLNQSTVTRGAQQVAALGCLHDGIAEEIAARSVFGAKNIQVRAAVVEDPASFDPAAVREPLADMSPEYTALPACEGAAGQAPSGSVILVQASYDQHFLMLSWFGFDASVPVTRTAAVVSNALEEGSS